MYTIEEGIVYDNQATSSGSVGKAAIGNEVQYSITNTTTQTIYQWQKFNLDKEVYEDDTSNTTSISGITPTDGKVIITKKVADDITMEELRANQLTLMNAIADLYAALPTTATSYEV